MLTRWIQFDFTAVENTAVLEKRVELEVEAGRPEEAERLAAAALEAHPEEPAFHEILAVAREGNAGPAELVLEGYRKALELDASRSRSMLALAKHDADSGDPAAAIARVEAFVQEHPEDVTAAVSRQQALWLAEAGRGEAARDLLRNLLAEDPTDVASALALARWHQNGGDEAASSRYALQAERFGGGEPAGELSEKASGQSAP